MDTISESSEVYGHQCEFVTQPNEELLCQTCKYVARDLTMTVCCAQHFCHECISPIQNTSKPCPGCGNEGFTTVPHVRYRKMIMELKVYCTMKDRGCTWIGKLKDLMAHINEKNDCQYVDVECPNKCSEPVLRYALEHHTENLCPKREYKCIDCGEIATYEVIRGEHSWECEQKEIPCPNHCRVGSIKQGVLQKHLSTCQLQQIECEVPGCNGRFVREDLKTHNENNTSEHIRLLFSTVQQLSEDQQESRARERDISSQMEQELEKRDKQNAELKQELQQSQVQIADLQNEIAKLSSNFHQLEQVFRIQSRLQAGDGPHHFTISDFRQRRENTVSWNSTPMYVSNGPKFIITLLPNGAIGTTARGTHVSVALYPIVGESDDLVKWPIRCTITVELRNQLNNSNHYRIRRSFQWERPKKSKTAGYFGTHIPENEHQFISHGGLEWNPQKQTKYLKDNTLYFTVLQIEPHSDIYLRNTTRSSERLLSLTSPETTLYVTTI